jgi:hypothetical protein
MTPQILVTSMLRFEIAQGVLEHEITSFLRDSIPDECPKGLIRITSTPYRCPPMGRGN